MRTKAHSNRYKRLRAIAKALAENDDVLMAKKVTFNIIVPVYKGEQLILVNPRAKKFRHRYKHRMLRSSHNHPFWNYGCAKRLYKDMKREGWGGEIKRLEKLMYEVTSG